MKDDVKIGFKLSRDRNGYPPADWEWIWARPAGNSAYEVNSIPFFVTGISSGDLVEAHISEKGLIFDRPIKFGGHSTLRVVVYRAALDDNNLQKTVEELRGSLRALGCSTELSHLGNLFAVDVPPQVHYDAVKEFLSRKEAEGTLEYEESALGSIK